MTDKRSVDPYGVDVSEERPLDEIVMVPAGTGDFPDLRAVRDLAELPAEIWDSDEELEAFLADLRASRRSALG